VKIASITTFFNILCIVLYAVLQNLFIRVGRHSVEHWQKIMKY